MTIAQAKGSDLFHCINYNTCGWQKGEGKTFSFSDTIAIQNNDSFV